MKNFASLIALLLLLGTIKTFASNGFTGQVLDGAGNYYLRARYYDPETGTFLSKDPMGVTTGLNSYQYVLSDPINGTDPLGLFETWDYIAQTGSLIGGGFTAFAGGVAFSAGIATAATGVGVGVAIGGGYLAVQGGSSVGSSLINLGYMISHPSATEVPLNSSGLGGLIVSLTAHAVGEENPAEITSVTEDGEVSPVGIANGIASAIDVVSTLSVGKALPNMYLAAFGKGVLESDQAYQIRMNNVPELAGFGASADGVASASTAIFDSDTIYSTVKNPPGSGLNLGPNFQYIGPGSEDLTPPVGGVLLNTAATLVGQNLSDITGAMYDPVSGQFVFLGTNSPTPVKNINLDYLTTALQAVYGSAVPPFVTLVPSTEITSLYSNSVYLNFTNRILSATLLSPFVDTNGYSEIVQIPGSGTYNGMFFSGGVHFNNYRIVSRIYG